MGSISVCRKPPHAKTFGVELECYPYAQNIRKTHIGFWEVTMDGSLNVGGREFVSQPMPYEMMIKQIKKIHQTLGGWTTDDTCGLHIHVSRKMWSDKRRGDFDDFLCGNLDKDLKAWFGRTSGYAEVCTRHSRQTNKYRAINLRHPETFEFRVWKAGDLEWTLEALRRTRAIVLHQGEYTREWMNKLCNVKSVQEPATDLGTLIRRRLSR